MRNLDRIITECLDRVILESRKFLSDIEAVEDFKGNPYYNGYDNPDAEGAFILTNGRIIYVDEHHWLETMYDIECLGAIRLSRECKAVTIVVEPTEKQYSVLEYFMRRFLHGNYKIEIKAWQNNWYNKKYSKTYELERKCRNLINLGYDYYGDTEIKNIVNQIEILSNKIVPNEDSIRNIEDIKRFFNIIDNATPSDYSAFDNDIKKLEKKLRDRIDYIKNIKQHEKNINDYEVIPAVKCFDINRFFNPYSIDELLYSKIALMQLEKAYYDCFNYIRNYNSVENISEMLYNCFINRLSDFENVNVKDSIDYYEYIYDHLMKKQLKPLVLDELCKMIKKVLTNN